MSDRGRRVPQQHANFKLLTDLVVARYFQAPELSPKWTRPHDGCGTIREFGFSGGGGVNRAPQN